jgi:hypothetical protein
MVMKMIRIVNKFIFPDCCDDPATLAYNILDTKTGMLLEENPSDFTYYIYDLPFSVDGKSDCRYERVIALEFVEVCETDKEDDLSDFGFTLINPHTAHGYKMWQKF